MARRDCTALGMVAGDFIASSMISNNLGRFTTWRNNVRNDLSNERLGTPSMSGKRVINHYEPLRSKDLKR